MSLLGERLFRRDPSLVLPEKYYPPRIARIQSARHTFEDIIADLVFITVGDGYKNGRRSKDSRFRRIGKNFRSLQSQFPDVDDPFADNGEVRNPRVIWLDIVKDVATKVVFDRAAAAQGQGSSS